MLGLDSQRQRHGWGKGFITPFQKKRTHTQKNYSSRLSKLQ